MKSRRLVVIVLDALFILAGCRNEVPPSRPGQASGPNHTWTGIPTTYTVSAHIDRGTIRFVTGWGDLVDTTDASYASGETATITHVWTSPGLMPVKVQAINSAASKKASDWSETKSVTVMSDSLPVIDSFASLPVVVPGVEYYFTAEAHDPDGDSIRIHISWGDGADTTTEFVGSPYYLGFWPTHTFTQVGTATVVITAQDWKGSMSLPETALVRVDTTGGVIWTSNPPATTPLVVNDGVEDLVYYGWLECQTINILEAWTEDGSGSYVASYPSPTVGAAYCAASHHIIVVSSGLWAQDRDLGDAWQCETTKSTGWGCPAISGDRIYIGNDDDTIYRFVDRIGHGARAASLITQGGVVDAPVIDAPGNVCFGTDSGLLYKVGPGLDTILWCSRLVTNGEVHSPIIGRDGTVYCAAGSQSIYAIDPATGTPLWTVVLDGQPMRLAAGQAAIFVGTSAGKAYSLDPATGGINWAKALSQADGFSAAPAIAADGSVYFQSDGDVLYRLSQADGTVIWECDCASYRGKTRIHVDSPRPSRTSPTEYPQNPTILPNGNVIVAGVDGLCCVAGSHAGPLDRHAPWPKWQHDLNNTGSVAGGR